MKIFRGKVIGGKIELPPDALPDGSEVAVVAGDFEPPFELTAEQERALAAAIEEISRGEFVDGHQLLEELRSQPRP